MSSIQNRFKRAIRRIPEINSSATPKRPEILTSRTYTNRSQNRLLALRESLQKEVQMRNLLPNSTPQPASSVTQGSVEKVTFNSEENSKSPVLSSFSQTRLLSLKANIQMNKSPKSIKLINDSKNLCITGSSTSVNKRLSQIRSNTTKSVAIKRKISHREDETQIKRPHLSMKEEKCELQPISSTSLQLNSKVNNDSQEMDNSMEWDPAESSSSVKQVKITAIVVDTNIFIHNLAKIKELLNLKLNDDQKLIIYVPWMVLQELDYIKHESSVKSKALIAQKCINEYLTHPESRLFGQSIDDLDNQKFVGTTPDDKILASCLQAKEKFDHVICLTNDINLRNKALINGLESCSSKEILQKVNQTDFVKIKVKVQMVISQIILHCCKEAFGDTISKMSDLQGSPWSFEGCLKRIQKYWSTVFRDYLLKHAFKTVDELIKMCEKGV
ncbi:hypothetical protein ABEB36_000574 [Hypothenemus hampei]|uniref:PIN domain-containing protein n=1 Tax=Hypothenemus hampei TaxID=57062 RepID=A0ABD1FBR5_HYPHA